MTRTALVVLTVALLATACSSDNNPSSPAATSTVSTPSTVSRSSGQDGSAAGDVVACSSFDGSPTVDVDEFFDQGNACGVDQGLTNLVPAPLGIKDLECVNGTYLYWNDAGWGPVPGTWTTSSRRAPPRDLLTACRGE